MDALNIRLAADGSLPTAAKSAGIVGTIQAQKPTWSHSSTETGGNLFSKGTISHPNHRLSLHLFPPFRPSALLSNILFKSNTNILFKVNTIINRVEEVLWCDIVVMWWYGKYVVVSVSNNRSYDLGGVEVVDSSKVPCWEHLCHHLRSLRLSGGSEFHLKLCANTFQVLAKQQ